MDSTPFAAVVNVYSNEIVPSSDEIISLRRQRNTRAPIWCLPDETLGEVFRQIATSKGYSARRASTWPRACLIITQVCHRWREVAIAHRQLWTYIDLAKSPELVDMFVERAGDCLCDIRLQNGVSPAPEFLARHARHIRSFERMYLTSNACTRIADVFGDACCFPCLEVLNVKFSRDDPVPPVSPFTPNTFPRLRRLRCVNVPPSFITSFPASELTSLTIDTPSATLTTASLVTLLAGLGTLENLVLRRACVSATLLGPSVVQLLRLKTLKIEDNLGDTALQILQNCHFPASTTRVVVYIYGVTTARIGSIVSMLAAVASGEAPSKLAMPPFESCSVNADGFDLWTFKVPVVDLANSNDQGYPAPLWTLKFKNVMMMYAIQPFFTTFTRFRLHSLALNGNLPYYEPNMGVGQTIYSTIRELFVNGSDNVEELIEMYEGNTDRLLFLPNIELLVLGVALRVRFNSPNQIREAFGLPPRLEALLRSRNQRAGPIKQLKFLGSRGSWGWDPLRFTEQQLVGKVEVEEVGLSSRRRIYVWRDNEDDAGDEDEDEE